MTSPAPQDLDSRPTVAQMIRTLVAEDDTESQTIIAGAITLYNRALRTQRGPQSSWSADDVNKLLNICYMLLSVGEVEASIAKVVGKPYRPNQQ